MHAMGSPQQEVSYFGFFAKHTQQNLIQSKGIYMIATKPG